MMTAVQIQSFHFYYEKTLPVSGTSLRITDSRSKVTLLVSGLLSKLVIGLLSVEVKFCLIKELGVSAEVEEDEELV